MHVKRSAKVAVAAAAAVVLTGGIAFAYWTANGAGTGDVATGSGAALNLVIRQTTPKTDLKPGGSIDLDGLITNPNPEAVTLNPTSTIDAVISRVKAGPGKVCLPSNYTLTKPSFWFGEYTINGTVHPAGQVNSTQWSGFKLSMVNDPNVNQDGCKGAIVHIAYKIVL